VALARTNAQSDHVVLDFSLLLSLHQGKESKKKLQHLSFFHLNVAEVLLGMHQWNFNVVVPRFDLRTLSIAPDLERKNT